MTKFNGQLHKMLTKHAEPIEYFFPFQEPVSVNQYLGRNLSLKFNGKISCIACKRDLKKNYQQGYCFPCTQKLASCDLCILKPERCHFHKGTCREPAWGLANCFIPHIVYLANSSGIKVGITRETQIPTRWIDQGAVQALPIFRLQSRYQAGLLEVELAKQISDKTDWRKMLRGENSNADLASTRDYLFSQLSETIQASAANFKFGDIEILTNEKIIDFKYPVLEYPQKINSLNFDKTPEISGRLQGIKGQYLIFEHGVINIRNFTGYEVDIA
jgi:hypothetical protein